MSVPHLCVLLRRPFFFLYRWVDLVPPALRALLASLAGQLSGNERPTVAVNLLRRRERAEREEERSFSQSLSPGVCLLRLGGDVATPRGYGGAAALFFL